MKVRNRILLLSSLLLLVSVGGIGNIVWQLPHVEQMQDLKAVLHCLILLGLFGVGLIFSVLELVRQELMSPIFQLAAQIARLKERKIDGHRLELTGSKDIDLLTRTLNDLLDGFEKEENLYRIFAENSTDMIYLLDRDGRVLFGNLNAARQWNYQAEEIIGKRQEELFPPDIAKRHKQVIQKVFNSGQPVCLDVHETIGQHQCWIDARMMPILDEVGHVTAVLGISRDITERKRAEESIKQSVEEWQRTFDSIPDFILILDNDNIITKANFRFAEAFNLSPEELIGKKCHEIFHKSDKPCPDCPYELTKKDKLPHSAEIDDPNIKIPLMVTTAPIFNDKNEIIGAIHVAKDISVLKKNEKEILELSKFPSENPSPVLRIAKDGEILYSNKPGLELLAHWNVKIGEKAPEKWRRLIKEALESAKPGLQEEEEEEEEEEEVKSKFFSIVISPVIEAGYANLYARDITESKKVQGLLQQERATLNSIIDLNPYGIQIFDAEGHYIRSNQAFFNMFQAVPPSDYCLFDDPIVKKAGFNEEVHLAIKEGKAHMNPEAWYNPHWLYPEMPDKLSCFRSTVFPIMNAEGKMESFVVMFEDITERKRAEEAFLFKAMLLEAQSETSIDGILAVDNEGHSILFNKRFGELWKVPQHVLDTKDDKKMLEYVLKQLKDPAEFSRRVACLYEHKDEKSRDEIEFADGRYFDRYSSPLTDAAGKYHGRIWYFRDITERKRAEETLKESEAKYKTLFTGAAEGILVADLQAKQFRYANPAACRMFGYTEEEFMRLGVADIHPKESLDQVLAAFETHAWSDKSFDLPCLRKDGSLFVAQGNGAKLVIDGRECNVGFFTDITEHRRMEEEKHRMEERSRKIVEDVFRFIPEGVLVFSRKIELLRQNQAFRDLVNGYAKRLGFAEDELENLIIDKVKAGLRDNNIKEIRIARKHETGK